MEIAKVIGKNIDELIKSNSMTIDECSSLIGVTRQTLSKYINGESIIDSGKLFILARNFNKSIQYFMNANEDEMSFMFRADDPKNNFSPKDKNFINDKFNKIFDLLSMAGLNKLIFIPESYKLKVEKRLTDSDKELIKDIAERERRSFDIYRLGSIRDVYSELEKKNINIIALDYENLDLDAISAYSNDKGAFIFINDSKCIPEERKIFSLLHEYGHLIFHREMYSSCGEDLVYSSRRNVNEQIANKFASYFLIPRDILRKELKVYNRKYFDLNYICTLKKKFGVSADAMLLALMDEGIISGSIYGHLRQELKKSGYEMSEPRPLPYEEKNEKIYYILKDLYLNDKITSGKVSDLLGIDMLQTRKLLKEWDMDEYSESKGLEG